MDRLKLEKLLGGREWMEVRCCCQPQKLLGWLPVPRRGNKAVFQLTNPLGRQDGFVDAITLPIHQIHNGGKTWDAIKAEGAPLETLRRIESFREAT